MGGAGDFALLSREDGCYGTGETADGMRLSPRDHRLGFWGTFYALALARHRRLTEAHEEVRAACRRGPQFYVARVVLALTAAGLGSKEEAGMALREARRLRPRLSLNEIRFWWGVARRFSPLFGARCRNPRSDHHHFRAGVAAFCWPRNRLPLTCHSNPTRELRRYCCDGGSPGSGTPRCFAALRNLVAIGHGGRRASHPPSRFMFTTWLKITSHSTAVIEILLTIVISHVFFFTQNLTVEQPRGGNQIDQQDPVREHQELTQQENPECNIDGVAAKTKDAGRHKFVRVIPVNSNAKALPEQNKNSRTTGTIPPRQRSAPTQETVPD